MKNLGNMLKEAQKLQSRMAEMQQKLAEIEMSGAAGGGLVTSRSTARARCARSRSIRRWPIPNEIEILEDLIVAACNDAKAKIEAHMQEEMGKLTGGLPLPPGFKLPF